MKERTYENVLASLAQALDVKELNNDDYLLDVVGLGQYDEAMLLLHIETDFGVNLGKRILERYSTVGDLVQDVLNY